MRKCLFAILAASLVGCEGQDAGDVTRIEDSGQKIELREAYLSDGTRCAILTGFSGGLSCDWRGPKRSPATRTSSPSEDQPE